MKFDLSINCAKNLDKIDPLSSFRKEFYYPKTNGNDEGIYLCSNSLGLQPKSVLNHINTELKTKYYIIHPSKPCILYSSFR